MMRSGIRSLPSGVAFTLWRFSNVYLRLCFNCHGYITQAKCFVNSAWWVWILLFLSYAHCSMGLTIFSAAVLPTRRLLDLAAAFAVLLAITVAMLVSGILSDSKRSSQMARFSSHRGLGIYCSFLLVRRNEIFVLVAKERT